ncbi:MAG TPA: T9SS type A sorting domain-containing protein [Edaphocola sp.]|nr:T9SS type A sorting domain-containing protein [Edaphocola sp.]
MKKLAFLTVALTATQLSFAQTTNPAPYCDASFDDMDGTFPVDDYISRVEFGALINETNAQFAAPHYVFYNNLPVADFIPGNTYPLNLKFRVVGGAGYGVWIDYNKDNVFDASEKIAGTSGTNYLDISEATIVSHNITIPATATPGETRMRIRIVEDDNHNMTSSDQEPCNLSTSANDIMDWGETEDYTINILSNNSTGINEMNMVSVVDIVPNPSFGLFEIQSKSIIKNVQVYTIAGKQVFEQTLYNDRISLDLSNEVKGFYFVRVNTVNGSVTKKVIFE